MSQSKTTTKKKLGRPKGGRSKKELKEYLKLRSREYYTSPENKEKQKIKMAIYREENRERINQKKRAKRSRDRLEKNLKRIWSTRGLLEAKERGGTETTTQKIQPHRRLNRRQNQRKIKTLRINKATVKRLEKNLKRIWFSRGFIKL